MSRAAALAALLACVGQAGPAAAAGCTLKRFAELPVTMIDLVPTVHARINGADAVFIADSGAFYSSLTHTAAEHYKLPLGYSPLSLAGAGGQGNTWLTVVKTFTIFNLNVPNVDFFVIGSDFGAGVVGVLGQNVFRIGDVEYDLANGVIRLVQPTDCGNTPLAYWAGAEHKPYSVIDIEFANRFAPHTMGEVYVNGTKLRVIFDTGAWRSIMMLEAAKRLGVTPSSPGVAEGGEDYGIGRRAFQTWVAPFASFQVGDEKIENARLRFGDLQLSGADMLIGADFFLSHRVYVASSQRKLYFTYNGGPVFDLTARRTPPQSAAAGSQGGTPAAAGPATGNASASPDQPTDAAGYARRGAASAARHDYQNAIADLTRACELAPTEPDYFYERGKAYWENNQPDLALADFDQSIKLKPDDVNALIARAGLRAGRRGAADAIAADLDAADRALPKDDDRHLQMGGVYEQGGQPAAAVAQYSKWIESHPDDPRAAEGLNGRCWARALAGEALDQALADCGAALKMRPDTAAFLDSRGLVYLRQGNYDKAIGDYDAALRLQPKLVWSLYGRGLARMRKGQSNAGRADIAAATALDPGIAARAKAYGIGP